MSDRWLYAWGAGYAAVGAASLLLPLYAVSLGAGAAVVGAMAATAAFAGVPGALLWGRLAARTGRRRPFVLVALGALAGVLALVPFASTPLGLLVGNAAMWFVVSAAAPVLNLIVVEGRQVAEWDARIARLNAVQGYGWVAGLVLGTVWTATVPRALGAVAAQELLCFLLAVVATGALAAAARWYPEPATTSAARFRRVFARLDRDGWGAGRYIRSVPYGPTRLYWVLTGYLGRARRARRRPDREGGAADATAGDPERSARDRFSGPLTAYLAAATLFSVGFAVFWGPMPAYLAEAGYATGVVFGLFLAANVGSAVCYTPVGRLAARRGPAVVQNVALAGRAALFPAVAALGTVLPAVSLPATAALGGLFLAIGVTWAMIAVTATGLVTRLANEALRGDALGAYSALAGVGTGLGSALGGLLAGVAGYAVAFWAAGGVVLVALAVLLRAERSASETAPTA
ncbi:hypothetical protein GCM10027435_15580 [Haloparvum alkalitolerans]|uniref:MFS transporter n=1 Tax=Haloparvum alkalitolerans TaxID=1042953 RepID=UPI003CF8FB90